GAEVKEGFEVDSSTKPGDEVTVEGGPIADEILKDLKELNPLKAKTLPNGRVVNLFTSVDLFVANGDIDNPIDLLDPDLADVHPPIPNRWWVDKRVDPSFSDSPQKDEDGGIRLLEAVRKGADGDIFERLRSKGVELSLHRLRFRNDRLEIGFLFSDAVDGREERLALHLIQVLFLGVALFSDSVPTIRGFKTEEDEKSGNESCHDEQAS
ncbi:hypothetical protein N9930_01150, partial [bacterium]|nr:hypothetical protein [bacterium]